MTGSRHARRSFLLRALAGAGAAGAAAALSAAPALADPLGPGSVLSAPASVPAGHPFTLRVSLVGARGALVPAGEPVIFSQAGGPDAACAVRFDPEFTVTDATGAASAQATLPAGCPGRFVLEATAAGAGSLTAAVEETGGFPNTTADPPAGPVPAPWWLGAGALLALPLPPAVLALLALRRRS